MATLRVGTTEQFSSLAAAVAGAQSGDTISIDAGTYAAQDILLTKDLTIAAAGNGPVVLHEASVLQKGMFISGSSATKPNVTIQGLTFQGATSSSDNGAGIRYQNGNLTLINDTFQNNQDGILATPYTNNTGTIVVQGSTFDHNGVSSGLGHNLYIGRVANFVMTNSVSENAVVGHEVKSRAFNNDIENNLIADGPSGTSSYSIDIPNGGNTLIQGNMIEQGPKSQNPWMIAYGEEGSLHPGSLTVSGNVLLNDLANGRGIWNASSTAASVTDNQTWGLAASSILKGVGQVSGNTTLTSEPALSMPSTQQPTGGTTASSSGVTRGTGGAQQTGLSFIGGSSTAQISATDGADDLLPTTQTSGIDHQTDPTQTGGIAPSDFATDGGELLILQAATTDPSATTGMGWLPDPSSPQLFATYSS